MCVRACVRAYVSVCVRACLRARARACVYVCVHARASARVVVAIVKTSNLTKLAIIISKLTAHFYVLLFSFGDG